MVHPGSSVLLESDFPELYRSTVPSLNVCWYMSCPPAVWTRWDLFLLWSKSCASAIRSNNPRPTSLQLQPTKPHLLISWHVWGTAQGTGCVYS